MDYIIKLTILKSVIIQSVKNETFLRGQIDKADKDNLVATAYHEQAGDEAYQEAILNRGLYTNLEELKTHFSDYLTSTGQSSGDNIYTEEEGNNIVISLSVSDRFNKGYTQSLARLSSKYIEDAMLMDWWRPINEKQSALYAQFVERDLSAIKRCFNKTAPSAPTVPYTTFLRTVGSAIELTVGEEGTVTYEISDGAIDDIECRAEQYQSIIETSRCDTGFTVKGLFRGHTYIILYSRHNTDISVRLEVYVVSEQP